jgi:hypothetical protein
MKNLVLLLAMSVAPLAASQVEDELARYREVVDKANRAYQEGVARERARSLATLTPVAKRTKGDAAEADVLWKLVLQLDSDNEAAREHFAANGKLPAVLASLRANRGPLIGNGQVTVAKKEVPRIDMTGAKAIRITSSFNSGYTLGSFKKGTVLIFQYVSGAWSGDNEQNDSEKNQNPDAEASNAGNRVQLFVDSGNEEQILTVIPPGTAEKPFVYTIENDVVGLSVRIANRKGLRRLNNGGGQNGLQQQSSSYTGDVKYLVRIVR